ncbi:Phospholipase D beta 2-like protein [Drosera capensis]
MSHGDELFPKRENDGEYKPSQLSAYPPIVSLIADMRLNDTNGSAVASPSAPSLDRLQNVRPSFASYSGRFDRPGNLYGYTSSSSSSWDGSISERTGTPSVLSFSHSSSFNHVQPAKNLPNMDMFHKTLGDVFAKLPGNVSNKLEGHMVNKITSDPYVSITISSAIIGQRHGGIPTDGSRGNSCRADIQVGVVFAKLPGNVSNKLEGHMVNKITSDPYVSITISSAVIGQRRGGNPTDGSCGNSCRADIWWYKSSRHLSNPYCGGGKPCKPGAVLSISIQYTSMEELSFYHHGVGAGPEYVGVPGTYFPLRKGGTVTLYQDAHVPDGFLPHIWLDKSMSYVHGKCWQDIFDAIRQARRLIYITGWSVWHKVRLVRDGGDCTLGELLRSKSQEGVRVLLLVWDDPASRSILGYRTDGIMQTHDEET